jgi:predicted ABC-type sugar transport system permease subunit
MLFDIRTIVGALLGCYAIVLVVTSLVDDTAAQQAKTGGVEVNLWAGLGMGAVAAAFVAWALLRPVQVQPEPHTPADESAAGEDSA